MKVNRKSRRMFLQGAGKTLMAIPFLPSLFTESAFAQTAAAPKRYIFFNTGLDIGNIANMIPNPSGEMAGRNLIPNRQISGAAWQPLNELFNKASQPLARLYGTSLNGVIDYVNILRGLDHELTWGHSTFFGNGSVSLSNSGYCNSWFRNITFDYFLMMSKTINPNGKVLACGVGGTTASEVSPCIDAAGNLVPSLNDYTSLYNRLFNNGTFPQGSSASTTTTTTTTSQPHRRYAVMNSVIEDYKRTLNSKNISSEDKVSLTTSMDLFSDILRGLPSGSTSQLTTITNPSCSYSSISKTGQNPIEWAINNDADAKLLVDMITAAFICDAGRVFSFGFSTVDKLNGVDIHSGDNGISHNPTLVTSYGSNWQILGDYQSNVFKRVVGPLATRLAGIIDPSNGKSILFNSLLHTSYEHSQTHSHYCLPAILIGNAGGGLTSGNYIDYSNRSKGLTGPGESVLSSSASAQLKADYSHYHGVSYNRIFVTIAQAMGLNPADYENNNLSPQPVANIGGWGYGCNGPVSAVDSADLPDFTQFKNKLPFPT